MRLTADPRLDDLPYADQQTFAMTIMCPACSKRPGVGCMAADGTKLVSPHYSRLKAAREPYRLAQAQKS